MGLDWEEIRVDYEAGASQAALARRHGVSRTAIQKHIAAEGWTRDISGTLNRLTEARVAGLVAGCTPKKKAAALESAAAARADVILRHKREWAEHQALLAEALAARDFEAAKLAKITAETIRIRQEGERRAWGLNDAERPGETAEKADVEKLLASLFQAYAGSGQ